MQHQRRLSKTRDSYFLYDAFVNVPVLGLIGFLALYMLIDVFIFDMSLGIFQQGSLIVSMVSIVYFIFDFIRIYFYLPHSRFWFYIQLHHITAVLLISCLFILWVITDSRRPFILAVFGLTFELSNSFHLTLRMLKSFRNYTVVVIANRIIWYVTRFGCSIFMLLYYLPYVIFPQLDIHTMNHIPITIISWLMSFLMLGLIIFQVWYTWYNHKKKFL